MNRTLPETHTPAVTPPAAPVPFASGGRIRLAGPADADRVSEFICGLSPYSRYLRFFSSVAPPSTGVLRALVGGTGADILVVTDRDGRVIAHGMAADDPVPAEVADHRQAVSGAAAGTIGPSAGGQIAASIGLVVADEWQERGLGTLLLSLLVGRAARRGIGSLVLDVLPENERMLGILARRWPGAPRERTPDAIVVRPVITARQAAAWRPVPAGLWMRGGRFSVRADGPLPSHSPAA